jgi:hypothetical protein
LRSEKLLSALTEVSLCACGAKRSINRKEVMLEQVIV